MAVLVFVFFYFFSVGSSVCVFARAAAVARAFL
jgi:hypothetical protein